MKDNFFILLPSSSVSMRAGKVMVMTDGMGQMGGDRGME